MKIYGKNGIPKLGLRKKDDQTFFMIQTAPRKQVEYEIKTKTLINK
jgi:hypothetical protein